MICIIPYKLYTLVYIHTKNWVLIFALLPCGILPHIQTDMYVFQSIPLHYFSFLFIYVAISSIVWLQNHELAVTQLYRSM